MALMPVNNPKSLLAYYLGFLALLPVIGLLAAVPSFIFGIQAIQVARTLPGNEGHGHALVGIILSGVGVFLSLGCGCLILLGIFST